MDAPRITEEALKNNIDSIEIVKHTSKSGQVLRWAVITTRSGFAVTGDPSCAVCNVNDNAEIGESIAISNAKHKLWELMGYALKELLHARKEYMQ